MTTSTKSVTVKVPSPIRAEDALAQALPVLIPRTEFHLTKAGRRLFNGLGAIIASLPLGVIVYFLLDGYSL